MPYAARPAPTVANASQPSPDDFVSSYGSTAKSDNDVVPADAFRQRLVSGLRSQPGAHGVRLLACDANDLQRLVSGFRY